MPTYVHTYIHAYIHTNQHSYTHASTHTYIHTYIHTHTYKMYHLDTLFHARLSYHSLYLSLGRDLRFTCTSLINDAEADWRVTHPHTYTSRVYSERNSIAFSYRDNHA